MELGTKSADTYQSSSLQFKIQQQFVKRVSICSQISEAAFTCASAVPLVCVLRKTENISSSVKEKGDTSRQPRHFASTDKMVPNCLSNSTAMLIRDYTVGKPLKEKSVGVEIDQSTKEKALYVSQ